MKIEKVYYKVGYEAYLVLFESIDNYIDFYVYPMVCAEEVYICAKYASFYNKNGSGWDYVKGFDKNKCLMSLHGTYAWRGIWERRLYFNRDEYWGGELYELTDLYKQIEVTCEDIIKSNNPNCRYEE